MAVFKQIARITMDAASNTSLSSAFEVPMEFTDFALQVPTGTVWCATTTCNVRIMGADTIDGTYLHVGFHDVPGIAASTTSGFPLSETAINVMAAGGRVVMSGFQYIKYGKLQFSQTATAAAEFVLYGRKND